MKKLLTIIVLVVIALYILSLFGGSSQQEETTRPTVATPEEPVATPAATPEPTPPSAPSPQYAKKLQKAAKEEKVRVDILKIQGNLVHVRVSWMGGNATIGGNFIDALRHKNIIWNFENVGKMNYWIDNQNRQQWSQEFLLRMV